MTQEGTDQLTAQRPGSCLHPDTGKPPLADAAEHRAAINDEAGYYVPAGTLNWAARYMSHRF